MGAARRLAVRRLIASWADAFLPVALGITVAASIALLAARVLAPQGPQSRWMLYGWGAALALAAAACALRAARRGYTLPEALARLDEVGGLHNRLTAALAGIGPWPAARNGVRDAVRWNWPRLGVPVLIGALLLCAAALVDLPTVSIAARPTEEPVAWTQMQSLLQTLDKANIVDQPALEKLKEQVEDLRQQPRQDWYSQNSLEAGNALQQQTTQALRQLDQNLQTGGDLMAQARQASLMSQANLQTLSNSLNAAVQGMASGNLPLNKDLAGQLRNFDPSTLRSLTPQQLQQLQQRLSQGEKVCSQCLGPNKAGTHPGNQTSQMPSGHPGGGGPADLGLKDQPEDLHTKSTQGDSNIDPTRALPAEVIAMSKGKHQVDKNAPTGPVEGGAISSAGQGGDAVWRDSLTPDEREVLQKYFH